MADGAGGDLLPDADRAFLLEKGYDFQVHRGSNELLVVIRDYELPATYSPRIVELMVVVPAGYPNAALDMFWTYPDVRLASGGWPIQAEHHQEYLGRNWQRWSRHFKNPWRPGIDSIRTFIVSVRGEINRGV